MVPSAPAEERVNQGPPQLPFLALLEEPAPDVDGEDALVDLDLDGDVAVANVVGVRLREAGRVYEFDAGDLTLERGAEVVVSTERGTLLGTVAVASRRREPRGQLRPVVRVADTNDLRQRERNREKESQLLALARDRSRAMRMPVKVFRAEVLPGHRLVLTFSAEDRVDLRELARDLSVRERLRVELRQVGVRDDAKAMGGIGTCGLELCCSTFLPSFAPVSIRMAKDQGIVLNPQKVSGQCGRLKCCLVYEEAQYREAMKGLPKLGKRVVTPDGEGRVQELDALRRRVRVSYPDGASRAYTAEEVQLASLASSGPSAPPPEPAPPAELPPDDGPPAPGPASDDGPPS